MRLLSLHIRNIASIEKADIDFEHGLNDVITGLPAPIFLISGDTGAGKSIILDAISMALYKKTPRTADVANSVRNDYTDAEGEQIRVASIEQYTRLGISADADSYSEVVFEGNDGSTYYARLTLGMKLGNRDKQTGIRPMKHRPPKWEIKIDNGDWTKDSVEQTILAAVGLDFQQFGRMAMLAQGQFANFLTGDKKEREAILEQLTNTQHFTAYGEAITSLWKKAKAEQELVQSRYDTEKPHTLNDDEVELLTKELQDGQKRKEALDKQLKSQDDRLKLVEQVLRNEKTQQETTQQRQEVEAVIAGEEYQRCKALFTQWDATTHERQQLNDLYRARQEERNAREALRQCEELFLRLSADLADRQEKAKTLNDSLQQTKAWIAQRSRYDAVFAKVGEIDFKIVHYVAKVRKASETDIRLKQEKAKTESLQKAEADATAKAKDADAAVKAKEQEIEVLSQQRTALNPQALNDQLNKKEAEQRALEDLQKACKNLQARMKEADLLRQEIKKEEEKQGQLKEANAKTETAYQSKKSEADAADKRLTTMRMSISDTLVTLRHRLRNEHTETCPLCGSKIDADHLDDDFNAILTPLEKEQQQAAEALQLATTERDQARDALAKCYGALQGKVRQLTLADKKNADELQDIESRATRHGLPTRIVPGMTPYEQTENVCLALLTQIEILKSQHVALRASQQEAERLQAEINKMLKQKKPLDTAKAEAQIAKAKAENDVRVNVDTITFLSKEHDGLLCDAETMKAEITTSLADYADEWLTDIETTRQRLKEDAQAYAAQKKLLADDTAKHDKATTLIATLTEFSRNILAECPKWQPAAYALPHRCSDIQAEWTKLLGRVTGLVASLRQNLSLIATTSESLTTYYQSADTSEQALQSLMASEPQVSAARKYVAQNNSLLKSRQDAIAEAQKLITQGLTALGLTDRTALPDRQQLEQEKAATGTQRDEVLRTMAQAQSRLDTHRANIERLRQIEAQLEKAKQQLLRWDKLNRIFGNTRFRTLVQTYILRPLLNNANIYLEQITDRYRLTCSGDNEQLSILVLDRYNKNQVRSVTVLSGGERFMISLALSLALSSLNRPDMNVNILFIDEGFGTLDEHSLDSVMQTLERLQEIAGQTNRRVGIISHREELDERIPVKIQVVKKGEGRSLVEVKN